MSDVVDRLFGEYLAAHRADRAADPLEYLARASTSAERDELTELIDGYLARAPRRAWDYAAFAGSLAERVTDDLERAHTGAAGRWPVELPRLRERAQITRAQLVSRLAAGLGVSGREAKVHSYYHQMEQGQVASAGVSDRVLDALAEIVGTSREALRKAGEAAAPSGAAPPAAGAVFARTALPDASFGAMEVPGGVEAAEGDKWDEVDELFRGG